jgi:SAM-dependent methyltransferase
MNEYERIGVGYAGRRRADPRLARVIAQALNGARSVVNVGAGVGSYEPAGPGTVAVEPAAMMIAQRPADAAFCVRGCAEALPFSDRVFDAGLAVLSIHHWSDWRAGLRELVRVVRRRVVLFTWDPECDGFWLLRDYLPEMLAADRRRFPDLGSLRETLGQVRVERTPIPHDCTDGFLGAYWRRPGAYLDPSIRQSISSFAREEFAAGVARLAGDLENGTWARKYGHVLQQTELDIGCCLVVADLGDDGAGSGDRPATGNSDKRPP